MSGINFLRRLLMKQAVKESAPHSGIMSIGTDVRKLVDKKVNRWIDSAKKQGQDIDKMGEQEIKYIVELNKPKAPTTLADMVEKLGLNDPKKNRFLQKEGQVIQADFGGGITDDVSEIIIKIKTMKPMDSMKEANKVLKGEGRYKSLSKADRKKIVDDESVTDHIFERNVDVDPEDFAHGGRTGSGLNYLLGEDDQNVRMPFKKGFSAGRRKFVQGIGALAALPIVGKYFKWAKPLAKSSKVLTSVPIKAGVDGMPAWFKPLVNKVIKEGDDVSKRFATQERQVVHQSTLPDSKTPVTVTQDLTSGNVSVDIGMGKHGFEAGHLGQPVRLEYRASEVIEPSFTKNKETIGKAGKTKEEFNVEEAEFTGGHPENIKFEESTIEKFGEHGSDFSEVEKFATGKTTKASKKGSKEVWEADWDDSLPDDYGPDDYASGGRVPLGGGGIAGMLGE